MEETNKNEKLILFFKIIAIIIIGGFSCLLIGSFAFISIVNAETGIQTTNLGFGGISRSINQNIYRNNNNIFSNWGRSYISFNVMVTNYNTGGTIYPIKQISVTSTSNIFVCNIGNTSIDFDYTQNGYIYDVICDVNIGVNGIQSIDINFDNYDAQDGVYVATSQYMTIYQNLELNIAQVLQQQQAITQGYLNTIHSAIDLNGTYIVSAIQALQTQQIQAINNNTQAVNGVNDSINDSSTDDPTNDLNDMNQNEISNSVISDLLLLPLNMFQRIINSINGTCSTFNLGSLYGSNLTLPCIDVPSIIGSNLWGVIDILFSGIFVLSIRKKFVDIFENITSLKDRGNELE